MPTHSISISPNHYLVMRTTQRGPARLNFNKLRTSTSVIVTDYPFQKVSMWATQRGFLKAGLPCGLQITLYLVFGEHWTQLNAICSIKYYIFYNWQKSVRSSDNTRINVTYHNHVLSSLWGKLDATKWYLFHQILYLLLLTRSVAQYHLSFILPLTFHNDKCKTIL